jgi:hypothetical protein
LKEIIVGYSKNHTKPMDTLCGRNGESISVTAGGTYNNHLALKDKFEKFL